MSEVPRIILHKEREKSILRRHPWVFSGAVQRVEGGPHAGETVDIFDSNGSWLARGAYAPESRIAVRIWTWNPDEQVNADFLQVRLEQASARRADLFQPGQTTAYREVFSEADGLPGLIVDRYGAVRVLQLLTPGMERWKEEITAILSDFDGCETLYERSDADARSRENLPMRRGFLWGRDEPFEHRMMENGSTYIVDIREGHKTGFYLDQRVNRAILQELVREGDVLNAFAYTGGFTVAALKGGAVSVVSIDSSQPALDLAKRNVEVNALSLEPCEWIVGDVFQELRTFRDSRRTFDAIVLDPPRFAPTAAQAQRAARGYKDINLLALKLLRPGGMLFTFSCSGGVSPDLFQKIVAGAALDADVDAQIIRWLSQPEDHPVHIHVPESRYLKGLVLRRNA